MADEDNQDGGEGGLDLVELMLRVSAGEHVEFE